MSRPALRTQDSRDSSSERERHHVSFSPAVRSPPSHRRPPPSPVPPEMAAMSSSTSAVAAAADGSVVGHLHPVSLLEHPECSLVIPCPVARACPVKEQQRRRVACDNEEDDDGGDEDDEAADAEAAAVAAVGGDGGGGGGRVACGSGVASRLLLQSLMRQLQLASKPDTAAAMQNQQAALLPGSPAPDFSGKAVMPDQSFKDIRLADYRGKYLVLFFYPADFTFVCPTEIIAFSDRAEEFRKANCELVACSTDTHFVHLAWTNTPRKEGGLGRLNMPLLADPSHAISRAYGVLKSDEGIAFRGLFVINDKGQLRQITINDLPVGRSVDETLRLVQAFQFTDKHGEVCPANWKPGSKTMKPDPVKSKDYFQSAQ